MAIRKVARLGHPVLRQVAQPIPPEQITSDAVQRLVVDLRDTMVEYDGVGLAAPQIFESVRAFIMYAPGDPEQGIADVPPTVWINPKLTFDSENTLVGYEGCLSIPDLRGRVERRESVVVSGYDSQGREMEARYEGFAAIVAQHEYDHLDGIVFLDRMANMSTLSFVREYERYLLPAETEVEETA